MIFIIVYFIMVILFLLSMIWILISLFKSSILNNAPFIPVMDRVIPVILSNLNLDENSLFVDAGCGNGKVLIAASKLFPNTKMIGIEYDIVPYLIAKWNTRSIPNITIIRKNIFDFDFSNATHIYTYLLSSVLDKIYPKFLQELKPGTMLVSCDFQFSKKKSNRIIPVNPHKKHYISNNVFVYLF